jgi:antitoxin component YwqK of YwqJK toxin-antitoxin module
VNEVEDGFYKQWYKNGQLKLEENYINNELCQESKYNINGEIIENWNRELMKNDI